MKLMKGFLSASEVIGLRKQHRQCKEKRYADRIKSMLMLHDGYSFEEIASILLVDDSTIRSWHFIFNEEGIEGILRDQHKGGFSKLDAEQLKALEAQVVNNVFLTAKSVCAWVKEQWGIVYTLSGMTDLLHALNFSYKKPSIVPGKHQTQEKQREHVAKLMTLIKNKAPEDQVYFFDAAHPMLNPVAGYGWIKKGKDKNISSNTGRERININGAFNQEKMETTIHLSETVNAQSTIVLIETIEENQPEGKIIIIADNARYYKCTLIVAFLLLHPRVSFEHLPSYSPNLNLIERLWKFYKKKVLCWQHYPNIETMKNATLDFFGRLQDYGEELSSLMTLNFQIIKS
jgi:transposase